MHRLLTLVTTSGLVALAVGCTEIDATGPDLSPPVLSQLEEDAEALIGGSLEGWWRAAHGPYPGAALSTAADAITSSWQNWGMLSAGMEPRQPLETDPDAQRNFTAPGWIELYRTLAAVRDGMTALDEGVDLGDEMNARARAFGAFAQGMALGTLAQLYDEAYILDENADPATVELSPYDQVMDAAMARLGAAIALAETNDFTIPSAWVGFGASLDQDGLARLARSQRARFRMSVARTSVERGAVDWTAVLADADAGIVEDWGAFDDGQGPSEDRWAWSIVKIVAGLEVWSRLDYRTIGPADQSGRYLDWLATPPAQRMPFEIVTEDNRITGATPLDPGRYAAWQPTTHFRPERGTDHFSMYADTRWSHLFDQEAGILGGHFTDFPVKELDFIRAEAYWHLGQPAQTMAIVNEYRAAAGLPPFTDPNGTAPAGGAGCIPVMPDGSCGDLFEALQYEKRLELFQYGPFTEFLDDRGWDDLVAGTFLDFPAPPLDLPSLLQRYYEESADNALVLANQVSAESLRVKREGFDRFDREQNENNDAGVLGG